MLLATFDGSFDRTIPVRSQVAAAQAVKHGFHTEQ
jgi:hypothetical protein